MSYLDEPETVEDRAAAVQPLIDSGAIWRLEGSAGREAMRLIESGHCVLGIVGHRDYWGNYVPSRYEVEQGTKGSASYAHELTGLEVSA